MGEYVTSNAALRNTEEYIRNIIFCLLNIYGLEWKKILEDFNGIVPENMEDLQSLPGVGRKSANVIMLEAFSNPQGIAVDTHAKRISNKIGFSNNTEPEKIEQDLLKQIPKQYYYDVNHLLVWHGRNICSARNPKCNECPVNKYCDSYKEF